jgi:hypothetical protein
MYKAKRWLAQVDLLYGDGVVDDYVRNVLYDKVLTLTGHTHDSIDEMERIMYGRVHQ